MICYENYFADAIQRVRSENRYRSFIKLQRQSEDFPHCLSQNQPVTLWCSNDYMGMSCHPQVIEEVIRVTRDHGVGSGGTRNISGTHEYIAELESTLADLHNKESALVFSSGYIANVCAITAICAIVPGMVILSDQLNHASLIEGIRNSGAKKLIFKHNDTAHLEELLQSLDIGTPKLIIFESVYSMTGDFAPMRDICDLARKYNALTFADEVHAVGIYGHRGGGLSELYNTNRQLTVIQGTLSKAYGAMGGYIASSDIIVDCIRSYAPGFIFTTSLPLPVAAGALRGIEILKHNPQLRAQFFEVVKNTGYALRKYVNTQSDSHIIPVAIGDAVTARNISYDMLHKHRIYIQHINYPTVPVGSELLRITPNRLHTPDMIADLAKSLDDTMVHYTIPTC